MILLVNQIICMTEDLISFCRKDQVIFSSRFYRFCPFLFFSVCLLLRHKVVKGTFLYTAKLEEK